MKKILLFLFVLSFISLEAQKAPVDARSFRPGAVNQILTTMQDGSVGRKYNAVQDFVVSRNEAYQIGDLVKYNGKIYEAILQTTTAPDAVFSTPPGPSWKERFEPGVIPYFEGDTYPDSALVNDGGIVYRNVLGSDNSNTIPGEGWKFANMTQLPPCTAFEAGDVALMVVAGQSNAAGQNGTAPTGPFPNVKVMMPGETYAWTDYTDSSNVYALDGVGAVNPLNQIAEKWQDRINAGESLPDLHILHVASSGNGITESDPDGQNRLNPLLKRSDSVLPWDDPVEGVINPLTSAYLTLQRSLRVGISSLQKSGKRVKFLGTNWNQWEQDSKTIESVSEYPGKLSLIRDMIDGEVGVSSSPFFYWYPRSVESSLVFAPEMRKVFDTWDSENSNVFRIDAFESPDYNATGPTFGVFVTDQVHYTPEVQEWAAGKVLEIMTGPECSKGVIVAKARENTNVQFGYNSVQNRITSPESQNYFYGATRWGDVSSDVAPNSGTLSAVLDGDYLTSCTWDQGDDVALTIDLNAKGEISDLLDGSGVFFVSMNSFLTFDENPTITAVSTSGLTTIAKGVRYDQESRRAIYRFDMTPGAGAINTDRYILNFKARGSGDETRITEISFVPNIGFSGRYYRRGSNIRTNHKMEFLDANNSVKATIDPTLSSRWLNVGEIKTTRIYDNNNSRGDDGQVMVNNSADRIVWTDPDRFIVSDPTDNTTSFLEDALANIHAATGGSATLGSLTDVDLTTVAPANGQGLIWDNLNSMWIPATIAPDDMGDNDAGGNEVTNGADATTPTSLTTLQQITRGLFTSVTTDANGAAIIPHTFGQAPTAVTCSASGPDFRLIQPTSTNATQIVIKAFNDDGTPYVGSVSIHLVLSFE